MFFLKFRLFDLVFRAQLVRLRAGAPLNLTIGFYAEGLETAVDAPSDGPTPVRKINKDNLRRGIAFAFACFV